MRYLILCDLDGTILNNNSELSNKTINYIKNISSKHIFCLITSNSLSKSLPYYSSLNLDTFIACKNGGSIVNPITSIRYSFRMDKFNILSYFNDLKDIISSCFYKRDKIAYCYNFDTRYNIIMDTNNLVLHNDDFNNLTLVDSTNLFIIIEPDNIDILTNYFKNKDVLVDCLGKDKKRAIFSITHTNASKKEALSFIKQLYTFDKTIGFGDSELDVEFLKECDISFLMKNTNVKNTTISKTDYTNNEDGVIKELIKLL